MFGVRHGLGVVVPIVLGFTSFNLEFQALCLMAMDNCRCLLKLSVLSMGKEYGHLVKFLHSNPVKPANRTYNSST